MPRRLWAPTAVCAATLALTVGCGGDGDDASATDEWASSVCTAVDSWRTSVDAAADAVQADPTREGIQKAADDLATATEMLVDDLKGLGRPETEAGQEAQDSVDELTNELEQSVTTMENAVDDASGASGVLNAVSVISGNLVTMGQSVTSTLTSIQELEGGEELRQAFEQADSCANLGNPGS
jgi:hypothetical protein